MTSQGRFCSRTWVDRDCLAKGFDQLIVNKATGQWGTEYNQATDLGRVPLTAKTLADVRDAFVISLEPSTTAAAATLHLTWGKTDFSVPVAIVP